MLKKTFILVFLIGSSLIVKAQAPAHVPLMTNVWKLIAEKKYKKNAHYKMVPSFPMQLKIMNNRILELPGYIIPIKAGFENKEFMLAVVPYDQCAYCGQGDIPSMVEVHSPRGVPYSDKPIRIRGNLVLNETGDSRSEIFIIDAELVK
ncbi:hypothetical protein WG906_06580 [Pedobacter sp. P351]|uniref:hypothetical protein n=1 Tax=Pedobacter superstes TaxID=3133441 RepID=UPI00309DB637